MNLITKSILELNALLVRELDDTEQGRFMKVTDEAIEFWDQDGLWSSTPWPGASTHQTLYEELERLTSTALSDYKKHCVFQGCSGNCTGYDSDHRNGHCDMCTRYKEECSCGE